MKSIPKRCPKCKRKLLRAKGEGYDTMSEDHEPFVLGRICKHDEIIFINPNFANYEIIKNEDVRR